MRRFFTKAVGQAQSLTALLCGLILHLASTISCAESPSPPKGAEAKVLEVRWNANLLENLGLHVSQPQRASAPTREGYDAFRVRSDSVLSPLRSGRGYAGLAQGTLYVEGGYRLQYRETTVDLLDFSLTWRGVSEQQFDIVNARGEIPLYADKVMAEPDSLGRAAIRTMDIRISAQLAMRLGLPDVAGWQIGTASIVDAAGSRAIDAESCPTSSKWPTQSVVGVPGQVYEADVFMNSFDVQMTGCRTCTGPHGKGLLKLTPTTVLRNNVSHAVVEATVAHDPLGTSKSRFAADIPWRKMFSRDCPPYANDQHPFLAWNLYRWDDDGTLEQVATSGVKHAHIAANADCKENPGDNHILGRGCIDAYGTGDNDSPEMLGPRAEVLPHLGLWGRCGSIYDPGCVGRRINARVYGDFDFRTIVREAELEATNKYWMDAWYVVRDDVDPDNNIAHAPLALDWAAGNAIWLARLIRAPALGSTFDEWCLANKAVQGKVQTRQGTVRVALALRSAQPGTAESVLTYRLTVMNVDYANASITGSGSNIRIANERGITGVSVTGGDFVEPTGRPIATAAWPRSLHSEEVVWTASAGQDLTWGKLLQFSLSTRTEIRSAKVAIYFADGSVGVADLRSPK